MPKKLGIFLFIMALILVIFWPLPAMESGLDGEKTWEELYFESFPPKKYDFKNHLPANLNKVWYSGNGSCMPYARHRSGLPVYGAASTVMYRLNDTLATTSQPQIGAVVITTDGPGHIAVVEGVSTSSILISEQNYIGLYQKSKRKIDIKSKSIVVYIVKK